jgi:ubiquinone/menaquinone biosynthesis C-methylase UbiE
MKVKKMDDKKTRVCPVELAGSLETRWRRWVQNPRRILRPYLKEGMTVLDFGCGPGYFTLDIAQMVGKSGRVIAADLQEGMLRKLEHKIHGSELSARINLHKCEQHKIGLTGHVDFVLAFYVLHEIPEQQTFFNELASLLVPGGQVLIVEPPFHVSRSGFVLMIEKAGRAGLYPVKGRKVFFNKTVLLRKN